MFKSFFIFGSSKVQRKMCLIIHWSLYFITLKWFIDRGLIWSSINYLLCIVNHIVIIYQHTTKNNGRVRVQEAKAHNWHWSWHWYSLSFLFVLYLVLFSCHIEGLNIFVFELLLMVKLFLVLENVVGFELIVSNA